MHAEHDVLDVSGVDPSAKKAGTYFDSPDEMVDLPGVQKGVLHSIAR